MDYLKRLQKYEDVFEFSEGVSAELISNAEKMLDITFPDDYKQYLLQVGDCSFGDSVILGIYELGGEVTYLSAERTLEYREKVALDKKYFVIQQDDIDFLVLYNIEDGKIYNAEIGYDEPPEITYIGKSEFRNFQEFFEDFLLLGEDDY